MKESLIFVCALAFSAAANAQSSVKLSGTVDATLSHGAGSLTSRSQLTNGGNSTSKLSLRGTEDLGGGMSAFFWLEAGFLVDSGTGSATNTNNQPSGSTTPGGLTFNRRAIVGLAGEWGEVHLGREWSPMYDITTGKFDPFNVGIGIGINYTAGLSSKNGVIRVSNAVAYITPKFFGGLTANVQHWLGENPSGMATSRDGSGKGIRLNYDKGPVSALVHWGRSEYAVGDTVYRGAALVYDFGPIQTTVLINNDRQEALRSKGLLVGAWAPVGTGQIKTSYSINRSNAVGDPEAKKLGVGYVHNLSKRTALYATLAHVINRGGSRQALGGATTGANRSSTGLDLGIRHNF